MRRITRFACGLVLFLLGIAQARAADKSDKPAHLVVKVAPSAKLEIEGGMTKKKGEVRRFDSPPLAAGMAYTYSFKATWKEAGKEMVREKQVRVEAGQTVEVDLRPQAKPKETEPPLSQPKVETPKPALPKVETIKPNGETLKPEPKVESPKPKTETLKEPTPKVESTKPSSPASLQLIIPSVLNLQINGFAKLVPIKVTREGFEGAVAVKFEGLPAGVSIPDVTIPPDQTQIYATTSLGAAAEPGDKEIKAVATGGKAKKEVAIQVIITKR